MTDALLAAPFFASGLGPVEERILRLMRVQSVVSRADIVETTSLSRAAVAPILEQLLDLHLIVPAKLGDSTGGRRPMLLSLNKDAAYIVGIDLGATGGRIGIANLCAEPLVIREEALDVKAGPEVVLSRVREIVRQLLVDTGIGKESILGIGVGVPGPVEFRSGRPTSPPIMPGWDGVKVSDYFSDDFDCPVYLDNDVNVMAMGEHWAGVGRGVDNLVFIKVATGIGAGIICNGQIYRGDQGCAGDVGHIMADANGPRCNCGNVGCLEAMAAAPAMVRLATAAVGEGRSTILADLLERQGNLTAVDIGRAASHGDQAAVDIVREAGSLIGQVLAGLVNFYNPSLIVIGGGVSRVGHLLLASIREAVYRRSPPLSTRKLTIVTSALEGKAGVIGCSEMVMEEILKSPLAAKV